MHQHNPHRHSIRCAGLNVTLDGFATRELSKEEARGVPCLECACVLSTQSKRAAKPDPESE